MNTLHALFEAQARRTPDRVALSDANATMTYAELEWRANRVALALRAFGIGPERLVALCVDRSFDLIVGMLGILKAGAAYLPLDPENPPIRLQMLVEDAAPAAIVTVRRLAGRLPEAGNVLYIDDAAALRDVPEGAPSGGAEGENLAYVIYTSGSTGLPKGVLVEHRNAVRLFTATRGLFEFTDSDVWTFAHSAAFDFSVWEIFGALLHGARLVIVPADVVRSPQQFYTLLAQQRVTVLNQTPSAFRGLLAHDAQQARDLALRYVIFGGEALDVRMLEPWFARHGDERPVLANMYGITETTVHTTFRHLHAADARVAVSPIGLPLPDLAIELLDESGRRVPDGEPGELYVSGAGVARGYLNRPELTAERFTVTNGAGTRRYRSGDRALRASGGELHYLGRVDEQVKVRGFRVEPREIECVLASDPRVMTAVVVAREYGAGDVRLVAHVVPNSGFDLATEGVALARELTERAQRELPAYLCPSVTEIVATLPITPNGKVDREALARPSSRPQNEAAGGTIAHGITAIWRDVLDLDEFGTDDDFFDLGGTSLAVVRMLGLVNERFSVALDPSALLEAATIEHLSRLIDRELYAGSATETTR